MKVISAGHVDMEEEVLDPYRGIRCSIIRFDIHGFEPVWEFMLHYFVCEAKRACGAYISGRVAAHLRWSPSAVFGLDVVMLCRAWLDSRPRASGHAPAIHRSIWSDLLYFPGPAASHTYIPELLCLCLYGEVVWAGVHLELPFCPGHVVVGQPHCALKVQAPAPHR